MFAAAFAFRPETSFAADEADRPPVTVKF